MPWTWKVMLSTEDFVPKNQIIKHTITKDLLIHENCSTMRKAIRLTEKLMDLSLEDVNNYLEKYEFLNKSFCMIEETSLLDYFIYDKIVGETHYFVTLSHKDLCKSQTKVYEESLIGKPSPHVREKTTRPLTKNKRKARRKARKLQAKER